MKQIESEHYVFNYESDSKAEQDISQIINCQEACFAHICHVLGVSLPFKIQYFLCNTREEVGRFYDGEPCNGLAVLPDKVYAVYNDEIQCIGFHEDAHIISETLIDDACDTSYCPAIHEGLAMCFDRKWWSIHNSDWAGYFIRTGQYIPISKLLDPDYFFEVDCAVSYPIMGAFTEWLMARDGAERYISYFTKGGSRAAMEEVYGKTPDEMDEAFQQYIRLFAIDGALEERMKHLHPVDRP